MNGAFEASRFGVAFDVAWAQSVFTHLHGARCPALPRAGGALRAAGRPLLRDLLRVRATTWTSAGHARARRHHHAPRPGSVSLPLPRPGGAVRGPALAPGLRRRLGASSRPADGPLRPRSSAWTSAPAASALFAILVLGALRCRPRCSAMELRPGPARAVGRRDHVRGPGRADWARGEPATLELLWPPLYPRLLAICGAAATPASWPCGWSRWPASSPRRSSGATSRASLTGSRLAGDVTAALLLLDPQVARLRAVPLARGAAPGALRGRAVDRS